MSLTSGVQTYNRVAALEQDYPRKTKRPWPGNVSIPDHMARASGENNLEIYGNSGVRLTLSLQLIKADVLDAILYR